MWCYIIDFVIFSADQVQNQIKDEEVQRCECCHVCSISLCSSKLHIKCVCYIICRFSELIVNVILWLLVNICS